MNRRIVEPLLEFLSKADQGTYMCDFQFRHINYADKEISCNINAGINYNNTTFIIEMENERNLLRNIDTPVQPKDGVLERPGTLVEQVGEGHQSDRHEP